MQINVEDLIFELLRYDRNTHDKARADRLARLVIRTIETMERETPRDVVRLLFDMDEEGHA